ncbi:hypothetical protein NUACC21_19790 [Scytonema sp. NUACC21]
MLSNLNKDTDAIAPSSDSNTELSQEAVLTMSCIGMFGRFGNQLFQYAFLRICAEKSGARVECPPWIGQTLFGHKDAPISKCLPPAIEHLDNRESFFDAFPEFIRVVEKQANARSYCVGAEVLNVGLVNVDLWGFFQIHTRLLKPHKEYFRSLFQPVSELKTVLEDGLNLLRSKGKTIVGIHIRRGDFIAFPLAGFTFMVPSKWWLDWLEGIWNKLEAPVLFLCSDDIDSVVHDFSKFSPVTSKDLNVKLPESMKDLNLEFYIDFFMLSNCDVVGISNSTFSFTACMLNERGKMFVRPHWDFSTKFTVFDPWDSQPLLYLGGEKPKFSKSFSDALYVTYITQGISGLLKFIFIYFPKSFIEGLGFRIYLGYQAQGFVGVVKSLFRAAG